MPYTTHKIIVQHIFTEKPWNARHQVRLYENIKMKLEKLGRNIFKNFSLHFSTLLWNSLKKYFSFLCYTWAFDNGILKNFKFWKKTTIKYFCSSDYKLRKSSYICFKTAKTCFVYIPVFSNVWGFVKHFMMLGPQKFLYLTLDLIWAYMYESV